MKLVLYSTTFCHLCEQAESLLAQLGIQAGHIDIAEDDDLLERYGTRIPVVKRMGDSSELGWPFDVEALQRFIE
jgi:glutaredoxin